MDRQEKRELRAELNKIMERAWQRIQTSEAGRNQSLEQDVYTLAYIVEQVLVER